MKYEFSEIIRYSQTDENLRLTVAALLDFFQDAPTLQAEACGVGVERLKADHLAWFLMSWNVEIYRMPMHGEKVTIGTFPTSFRGIMGRRNCYLKSESGEYLAKADSLWVIFDTKKGGVTTIPAYVLQAYEVELPLSMESVKRHISLPEGMRAEAPIEVRPENIDYHGHVNNAQYIRMVNYLLPKEPIRGFQVEYIQQTRLGETLIPYVCEDETQTVISLQENGDAHVTIRFEKM